jgi:hypothetical protein
MDWWNSAAAAVVGGVGWFVGQASDNLHSGNAGRVVLGVLQSVVIAIPVAAVIFFAGGGAVVASGLDAVGSAFGVGGAAAFDTAAVITPSEAAAEVGATSTNAFGQALWGSGEAVRERWWERGQLRSCNLLG